MSAWDTAAENFMAGQGIPGGTLIVGYEGRVLLERGYGYANVASKTPVVPTDAFRLASVSKSLTYAAIGQLIAQHKLTLNEKPFTSSRASSAATESAATLSLINDALLRMTPSSLPSACAIVPTSCSVPVHASTSSNSRRDGSAINGAFVRSAFGRTRTGHAVDDGAIHTTSHAHTRASTTVTSIPD
jgi:Beta-lactamase